MSMDEFIKTLTEEQKKALLKALSGGSFDPEVPNKPFTTHPPFIDRLQHEEPISEAVDGDFTMHKKTELSKQKRREKVKASDNTWTDTGEHRDVETPDTARTPRNRPTPKKKTVRCHICSKDFTINASLLYGEYYRCDRCTG